MTYINTLSQLYSVLTSAVFYVTEIKFIFTGNDNLHLLTSQSSYCLVIDMRRFNGEAGRVIYSTFSVASEADNYRLTSEGFSGNNTNTFGMFCIIYITLHYTISSTIITSRNRVNEIYLFK